MTWQTLLLATLAAYRVGLMVSQEEGPFNAFRRLRERVSDPKSWVATGLRCGWCVSFWAALVLAVAFTPTGWDAALLNWLGIAGGAVMLDKVWKRG